ncbi:MAG: hypothetical protein AAF658_14295, partial [Myxococcota bacterium]
MVVFPFAILIGAALAWALERLQRTSLRATQAELASAYSAQIRTTSARLALEELTRVRALENREFDNARDPKVERAERSMQEARAALDGLQRSLDRRAAELDVRGETYDQQKERTQKNRDSVAQHQARRLEALESTAGVLAQTLHREQVERWIREVSEERGRERSLRMERIEAEVSKHARELLAGAIRRYEGQSHLERVSNTFEVKGALFDGLKDPGHPLHQALSESVKCDVLSDDERRTLTLRADDPLVREHGRRVLRRVLGQKIKSPDAIRELAASVYAKLESEVQIAGARA